jgi:hypothetical protein
MKRVEINKQLEICIVVCIHQQCLTDILRDITILLETMPIFKPPKFDPITTVCSYKKNTIFNRKSIFKE